jgi:hypothetical protein
MYPGLVTVLSLANLIVESSLYTNLILLGLGINK